MGEFFHSIPNLSLRVNDCRKHLKQFNVLMYKVHIRIPVQFSNHIAKPIQSFLTEWE